MAEVAPVKFKRRKVSAVRDFPRGCGPNAAPLTPQKRPRDDTADLLKTPNPEPLVELPNSEESPQEDGKGDYTLPDSSVKLESANFLNGVSDHDEPTIAPLVNEDVVEKQRCLRLYPLPKRRKVSAVRDFPAGCGPDAPQLKRDENLNRDGSMEVDGAVKSVLFRNHQVEMDQDLASQKVEKEAVKGGSKHVTEDPAKSTTSPLKSKSMDGEKKTPVKELALEGSMKVTDIHKDGGVVAKGEAEQIPDVQNRTSSEAAAKIAPAPLKSRSKDVEKKPLVKQRLSSEGPINVTSADKSQGDVKRNDAMKIREKAKEMSNEVQFKSALESTLGAGTAEEHSDKKFLARSTAEKKLEGREETRSDTQVKSAPKSGLGEKTAEEHKEKKVQARSTPERRLDGHGVKLVSQRILVKEASDTKLSLDTKSQSGSKAVFKEASSSAGKMIYKHQSDTKVPKRKFSEEEKSKEPIARGQMAGNSPVVVNGDRLIVQALMAAENCPWRQGRNSVRVNSRSAPPKSSVKKERKSLSNSPIMGASASKLMDGIDGEDKEDSVMHGEEYEKTLVLYNEPRERSVTMPPLVPPKHEHKGSDDELSERGKVKRTLRLFQMLVRKFVKDEESKKMDFGRVRVDYKAADILKKNNWSLNPRKAILGHVPGVEVGDEFHYRVEIALVGLHRPYQGGIDSTKMDDDTAVATSIVASCGYADDIDSSDVLIYSGSGGNPEDGCKQAEDQKLERGNLALKNSIELGTPVRVIRGFKEAKALSTFTYDGLYVVENYWKEEGRKGFSVLKFQLRRMAGQPELSLKEVKRSKKAKEREGLRVEDISEGKESIPICAVNTIDDDVPLPFKYTSKNIYPSWHVSNLPRGCECIGGCSDSDKCACAVKNGGEIPFNQNGAIMQAKPLVYECGPTCKCPQSCPNRVSQHGIRRPLEIFKTESRGWGVRSLYSIPSGSFICEYIGELLKDSDAEQRSNDEYLFDIGHNYEDRTLWEGLPSLIPGLQANSPCETVDDAGFTIDAAEFGNVGRFINHSCSPNIYAQNVLYDHDDKRMPHIMFFAADNIPPLQELTYHYNYTVDQVRDSEGNIKQKNCYCGAPDCTGRLY